MDSKNHTLLNKRLKECSMAKPDMSEKAIIAAFKKAHSKAYAKNLLKKAKKDYDKALDDHVKAGGKRSFADLFLTTMNKYDEEKEKKMSIEDFKNFRQKWKLSDKELLNVISNNPQSKREQQAYDDYLKTFEGKKFTDISKSMREDPEFKDLADLYDRAKEFRDVETLKSKEQQEAIAETSQKLLDEPAYEVVSPEPVKAQRAAEKEVTTPGGIVAEQVGRLGEKLSPIAERKLRDREEKEKESIKKKYKDLYEAYEDIFPGELGKSGPKLFERKAQEEIDAVRTKYAKIRVASREIGKAGGELLGMGAEAYRRGAPPVERFGTPGQSEMLDRYDALVNMLRPERTTPQSIAAALAPYGTQAGATLGRTIGTLTGTPLGPAVGGTVGSLLGLGAQEIARRYGQPDPEFAQLGRFLSGTPAGYLQSGTRGLAGLIAGEDPRSTLRKGFGLFRQRPTGRISKLRQALGGGVRGLGQFIGAPGRAQQLRNILATGEALYGLGEELGINPYVRRLGERLGLVSPEQYGTRLRGGTGMGIAGAALPSALQFAVPELQQQAARFYGRPVPAEEVVQGLDQQMLAALGPQIAAQDIKESEIRGKKEALKLKKAGLKVDKATQEALSKLQGMQQQQKFQRAQRRQGLAAREMVARAKVGAQRGRLSAAELLSGQQVARPLPLERVQPQPGLPEGLDIAASKLQQATTPYIQQSISDILRKPVKFTNPVIK